MMATFFAYYAIIIFSLPWGLAFFVAIFLTILLGVSVDRFAYRPLRNSPRISCLCSAIGMSFLLENFAIVVFGGRPKAFFRPEIFTKMHTLFGVRIHSVSIITPIIAILALLVLTYIVHRTKVGLAMRSISRDFDTANLMGILTKQLRLLLPLAPLWQRLVQYYGLYVILKYILIWEFFLDGGLLQQPLWEELVAFAEQLWEVF